ncbi:aromatic amino acid transport family protein [Nodularia harveyana UHCC-0300]|uniref:Aromatic amino acid transport family protein n=1 Tax=Nodularia harveyana UHCC-0300 TaxID=2974287 RepID=A0ABU5UGW8_9CYAN|nr:aromatic amino acid transport family protein [Nodularia harveyana]MEA5582360.1 aromatic amino acid transport family protein [Nodularia harveyana UHCC-0300]
MTPTQPVFQLHSEEVTRLCSHVELNENKFSHQPGSVFGNIALIAGTTVGAGILALPAVTLPSGVFPSTVLLIAVWLYTVISGLLLAEVCVNAMRLQGRLSIGLLSMVEGTLGFVGARIAGAAYLFLNYALLVAYMTEGGNILVSGVSQLWGLEKIPPAWLGTMTFTVIFGGIMYLGREKFIEKLNSTFVVIVITSFVGLLFLGGGQVKTVQLFTHNWTALGSAVSVMLVALFFHNVVPVVVTQLEGDIPKIRQSILIGSLIPLIMFLIWNAVILGSFNPEMVQSTDNFDPLQILRSGGNGSGLGVLLSIFSEFAIATSFIGFVYGLLDFFQDIFPVTEGKPSSRLPLYSLILLPPMSLGAINPSLFFSALDFAGTFSISVLGGIIPALMSWKQRQEQQLNSLNKPLVPGGKLTLIIIIVIASILMIKQILAMTGHL